MMNTWNPSMPEEKTGRIEVQGTLFLGSKHTGTLGNMKHYLIINIYISIRYKEALKFLENNIFNI